MRRGAGRLLFTTGSGAIRPSAARALSAVSTAAESACLEVLREGVEELGVQVVHPVVVGPVGGPGHRPDAVADALHTLAGRGDGFGVSELEPGGTVDDVRSTLRHGTDHDQVRSS